MFACIKFGEVETSAELLLGKDIPNTINDFYFSFTLSTQGHPYYCLPSFYPHKNSLALYRLVERLIGWNSSMCWVSMIKDRLETIPRTS